MFKVSSLLTKITGICRMQDLIKWVVIVMFSSVLVLLLVSVSLRFQVGLLLFMLIWFAILPLLFKPLDIFSAKTMFIVGYIAYSFALMFHFFVTGQPLFIYDDKIVFSDFSFMLKIAGLYALGILGFYIGYLSEAGSILAKKLPIFNSKYLKPSRLAVIAFIYVVVGALLLALLIVKVGGLSSYLHLMYYEKYIVARGLGWLVMGINLVTLGLILIYWWLKKVVQSKTSLLIYWAFIGFYSYIIFLTGRRAPLLFLFLGIAVFYHYSVKPFSLRKALTLGFSLFLVFIIWAQIRAIVPISSASEMGDYVQENINFGWFNPAKKGFGVPPYIIWKLMKGTSLEEYQLGKTYLQSFPILVPKVLYPSRPLGPAEWFALTYYPDYYNIGGGFGFSYLAESYLNFSIFGPFFISLIIGILFKMFDRYRSRQPKNNFSIFIYSITMPWIIWMFRSDFASMLKGYFLTYLIPAVVAVGFISNWRLRK